MLKEEVLDAIRSQWGGMENFVFECLWETVEKHIDRSIKKEIAKRNPNRMVRGRPHGRKNFGARDYWQAVELAAKKAPVSLASFPNTPQWRDGVYRCGSNGLLEPVQSPEHSQRGEYFAHVNAPWKFERQPFDFCDLAIAKKAVSDGRVSALDFSVKPNRDNLLGARVKFKQAVDRLRQLESLGFVSYDPAVSDGHAGNFRPKWYRPTEKLHDLMLMM